MRSPQPERKVIRLEDVCASVIDVRGTYLDLCIVKGTDNRNASEIGIPHTFIQLEEPGRCSLIITPKDILGDAQHNSVLPSMYDLSNHPPACSEHTMPKKSYAYSLRIEDQRHVLSGLY